MSVLDLSECPQIIQNEAQAIARLSAALGLLHGEVKPMRGPAADKQSIRILADEALGQMHTQILDVTTVANAYNALLKSDDLDESKEQNHCRS